ncbi:uncharacterized protein C8Q71DRAFT_759300 [Rhodofomes roseus]|uniref:Uncharacterized protein n=1 Tax=Rhodofomes roseus TaxID=34475 RepID=A0ABQ8KH93_9APHY|nr:uncharacterized protein C8Q71DRAFT_759300 [Rhodofomes roseus]KAH9836703.1 hypothetical protein C8Q71DRAFT_759300 [Rhodofomes roseus]
MCSLFRTSPVMTDDTLPVPQHQWRPLPKQAIRAVLGPSTAKTVAAQGWVWFTYSLALFLVPLAIVIPAASVCVTYVGPAEELLWLALVLPMVYLYVVSAIIIYAGLCFPATLHFERVLPAATRLIRRRSHVSNIRPDRFKKLVQSKPYTIFVHGTGTSAEQKTRSTALLVYGHSTVTDIWHALQTRRLIPASADSTCFLTSTKQLLSDRSAASETLRSIGLGPLSHLTLRVRVCGGSELGDDAVPTETVPGPSKRVSKPSRKVVDPDNIERGALPSGSSPATNKDGGKGLSRSKNNLIVIDDDSESELQLSSSKGKKRQVIESSDEGDGDDRSEKPRKKVRQVRRRDRSANNESDDDEDVNTEAQNADGTLRDLDHIRAPPRVDEDKLGKTADVNEFFDQPYDRISEKNTRTQRVRDCKGCR